MAGLVIPCKHGKLNLLPGANTILRLGAGLLYLYLDGPQHAGLYMVDYWSNNIVAIHTIGIDLIMKKESQSFDVKFTNNSTVTRNAYYLYLGLG